LELRARFSKNDASHGNQVEIFFDFCVESRELSYDNSSFLVMMWPLGAGSPPAKREFQHKIGFKQSR